MRRTWLRGHVNVKKRYLPHVAGYNLGLILRLLTAHGNLREAAAALRAAVGIAVLTDDVFLVIIVALAADDAEDCALVAVIVGPR